MDIEIKRQYGKTIFKSLTEKGYRWIIENFSKSFNHTVSVEEEYEEELIEAMRKDGLSV